jgi:CHAT domain-containing protein
MEKYPTPTLDQLTDSQQEVIKQLILCMEQKSFNKVELDRSLKDMVDRISSATQSEEDIKRMLKELGRMVRWRRLRGYWLSFLFQCVTKKIGSIYHIAASQLFSDSQFAFGDDLGFHSLEVAEMTTREVMKQVESTEAISQVENAIISRMKAYTEFYAEWCETFRYSDANPLSGHLDSLRTWFDLYLAFPEIGFSFHKVDPKKLLKIVEDCATADLIYYRIIARRFLGWLYEANGQFDDALSQFEIGLHEALEAKLESEIGHYHRLYGSALMKSGLFAEALDQHKKALAFELKAYPYSSYWAALSFRELGDALLRNAAMAEGMEKQALLNKANDAYREGLNVFDSQRAISPAPQIFRIVKRLLFRSFSENAFQLALLLGDLTSAVAEAEAAGQCQATEMVSETGASRCLTADQRAGFRRGRRTFQHRLSCTSPDFSSYWKALPEEYQERRQYIELRRSMTRNIVEDTSSYGIANKILSLEPIDCVLVLFYVGQNVSNMLLLDLKNRKEPISMPLAFTGKEMNDISRDYHAAIARIRSAPSKYEKTGAAKVAATKQAVGSLIERYEKILGPPLSEILPMIKGRHLIVVPKLQMNEVPIHALKVSGKCLLEHCIVSYCPTVGVFLNLVSRQTTNGKSISAVYDEENTSGFFNGAFRMLQEVYLQKMHLMVDPTWKEVLSSPAISDANDIIFACHGRFNARDPFSSDLQFSGQEVVTFSEIFSELDLGNCRSVTMAACESGLVRAELAEEYIGLPGAFLSAGVQNVVGSLWTVNELATSIILGKHFQMLADGRRVSEALCESELHLMAMKQEEVIEWIEKYLPMYASILVPDIQKMGQRPFDNPYYWAGFYATGGI